MGSTFKFVCHRKEKTMLPSLKYLSTFQYELSKNSLSDPIRIYDIEPRKNRDKESDLINFFKEMEENDDVYLCFDKEKLIESLTYSLLRCGSLIKISKLAPVVCLKSTFSDEYSQGMFSCLQSDFEAEKIKERHIYRELHSNNILNNMLSGLFRKNDKTL